MLAFKGDTESSLPKGWGRLANLLIDIYASSPIHALFQKEGMDRGRSGSRFLGANDRLEEEEAERSSAGDGGRDQHCSSRRFLVFSLKQVTEIPTFLFKGR